MQRLDEYPPPPSQHLDYKMASVRDMQQSAVAGQLPPHMTHSHPSYAQQQHSYQTPPSAAAQQDPRPDPLPPHLQHMGPPQGRGAPSGTATAARPSGVPEHLQPRPFSRQRGTLPRDGQQHTQAQGAQQRPLPPMQQQMGSYTNQGAATGTKQQGPSPEPTGPSGSAPPPAPAGPEPGYRAPASYVGGGGNVASSAVPPGLEPATEPAGQSAASSGWYRGAGPAQHAQAQSGHFSAAAVPPPQRQQQQQQRSYDADYQQAPSVYASAPAASQQQQPRQQPTQQQMQQTRQQEQQQYPPPPAQQHAAPSQQYQQHPYQQHVRSAMADEDPVGQMPRGQHQASGQAPAPSAHAAVMHGAGLANGGAPRGASQPPESHQYPAPPAHLKPSAHEIAATPVSFVQLVPQTAGIQVDQSGAVRVVVQQSQQHEGAVGAGGGAGVAPGQATILSSHNPAGAGYGPAQPQQPQHQLQPDPQPQPQRYGSMGAPSAPSQPPPQQAAREPAQSVPFQVYDIPPGYQQPGDSGAGGIGGGGGASALWDEPAGHHRDAAGYAPYGSRYDNGGGGSVVGDGRNYIPAADRSRPPPAPPPVNMQHDVGYGYDEPSMRSHYPSNGGGGGGGGGGLERHGSRTPASELESMASDGYGAAAAGAQRGVVAERLDSRGDIGGAYVEARPSAGSGARAPVAAPAAMAEEPPLPLPEAMHRAEALVATVKALRMDGDLMLGMQPQLLQTCEKRVYDLSLALRAVAVEAEAARAAAAAAAARAAKAEADATAAEASAAADAFEGKTELGQLRPGHYAFLVERAIRTVWPLDTPEHALYRVVAEVLLMEEGGREVTVNNELVMLKPHEMLGASLCNLAPVQEKVAEVRAACSGAGSSTVQILRQDDFFEVVEHKHKLDRTSLQWLVRLRAEQLPSYADVRRVLGEAVDTALPPPPSSSSSAAARSGGGGGGKSEAGGRQSGSRAATGSPSRGRSSFSGGREPAAAAAGTSAAAISPGLQFLGREPEGEQERQVLRHAALHLLGCKNKEIGLFQDVIESVAEVIGRKLPSAVAKVYGKGHLPAFKRLLNSHPFFRVAPKSVYAPNEATSTTHECVSLCSGNMLEFGYRARLVLQLELQALQQSKRRKTGGPGGAGAAAGGGAEGADQNAALEEWWREMRRRRKTK